MAGRPLRRARNNPRLSRSKVVPTVSVPPSVGGIPIAVYQEDEVGRPFQSDVLYQREHPQGGQGIGPSIQFDISGKRRWEASMSTGQGRKTLDFTGDQPFSSADLRAVDAAVHAFFSR